MKSILFILRGLERFVRRSGEKYLYFTEIYLIIIYLNKKDLTITSVSRLRNYALRITNYELKKRTEEISS
ncbi:MAG: hypothetical protein IKS45_11550, partial [Thermoguttaceae bacterium]|nr:hypothetical protein [Thermoguttaceae bacterium]